MPLDLDAIQRALADDGLDGWLLYDFHGSNPIAVSLAGVGGRHVTRRWYYFIPRTGSPAKLVHAIEAGVLSALPGATTEYAGRVELESGLRALLAGAHTIAMEYSPKCAIPYIARVDAGTIELVRECGVDVVSSGDLVGRFEAAWGPEAVATHRAASNALYRVKDRAFALVAAELSAGRALSEIDVQRAMVRWFGEAGLITDSPPIVSVNAHAGDPHYAPTAETSVPIRRGDLLLLDLWGKLDQPDFLNAVAELSTSLEPHALLDLCLDIERQLKRVREERWGPRLVDLDILTFGARTIHDAGLDVPHPRMLERAFVLVPLAEIAPDLDIGGTTLSQRLKQIDGAGIEKLPSGNEWWRDAPGEDD